MKWSIFAVLGIFGALVAGSALAQSGFVHPGGTTTSDGITGKIYPGGAATFSDGTSGFVHPGGTVTISDGRSGFLHPGGALDLPPKPQEKRGVQSQADPGRKAVSTKRPRKPINKESVHPETKRERMPRTRRSSKRSRGAKFIEIHEDGTVTETYH